MDVYRSKGTLGRYIERLPWPGDFISPENLPQFLSKIHILEDGWHQSGDRFHADVYAAIDGEVAVRLPALDCASFVMGADIPGYTLVKASIEIAPEPRLSLNDVVMSLRFDPDVLKPAPTDLQPIPPPYAAISMSGSVHIDSDFDFELDGFDSLSLSPVYIGDTGIIISASGIKLDLSRTWSPPEIIADGFGHDFIGIYIGQAQVRFPPSLQGVIPAGVLLEKCAIGSGGISGELEATYGTPQFDAVSGVFTGPASGDIFGVPFGLESVRIEIRENALVDATLKGAMLLPFFDRPVAVRLSLGLDGGLSVALDNPNGLATLPIANVLDLELDSLKFVVDDGLLTVTLSGMIIPKLTGLNCPPIRVDNLSVNSRGELDLPGGWLMLPKQYGLDFHSFKIEITKLGMGREPNGDKWFGFSGGIKLVDGLPAGVSVDGLRITCSPDWSGTPRITLSGVGVELEIKDVLYFKGAVAFREMDDGQRFDGAIRLELKSLDFRIDGQFVVGSTNSYRYMALYLGVDLPTGLPLAQTGLAVYGMAGLFALRMEPNKGPSEAWYGIGAGQGWYKRNQVGVVDLANKWHSEPGSKALGAGLTFGTFPNSTLFNGRALFVGVFPGPILLLEGAANIAKDRAKLGDEPLFRSLAVFDNRAGSLLIGLDVNYKYDAAGKLIKLSAGTEAYYEFDDPMAWRINVGLDTPKDRRIQAEIFSLFNANAYIMLNPHRFAMGAWVGYTNHWRFGPLKVGLEAWMETNVLVSFKPLQFYGDMALHGAVDLQAFGFGFSLTVDAAVQAEVFKPKHLLAQLDVTLNLPAPLPKKKRRLTAHCRIEFGPEPDKPPIPVALKSVSVEHMKVSTTWPLPAANGLLQPVVDDGEGFLTTAVGNIEALPASIPVVPIDARPSLHFGHNMHDEALVGAVVQTPDPAWEWIGDPEKQQGSARVRYSLVSVILDKWTGSSWAPVAGKGSGADGLTELFGSWTPAAANGGGVAQDRLLLWSQCGFDSFRNTGMAYGDWFAGAFGGPQGYPCIPVPTSSEMCLDFSRLPLGPVEPQFAHPDHPGVIFECPAPGRFVIREFKGARPGEKSRRVRALCVEGGDAIDIRFIDTAENVVVHSLGPPPPVERAQIVAGSPSGVPLGVNLTRDATSLIGFEQNTARIDRGQVSEVGLRGPRICLTEICGKFAADPQSLAAVAAGLAHNQSAGARWSDVGNVLEPHTIYRLRVATRTDVAAFAPDPSFNTPRNIVQAAFFRTEGPPGLAQLSVPIEPESAVAETALDDLGLYVGQTIPPTVPPRGQTPRLPRPVYRAYDPGIAFNVDYVDLMYRIAGRDLSLILYDRNNQPVRSPNGGVAIADNPWGVAETLTLASHETSWLAMIAANGCVPDIDQTVIPGNLTLAAAAEVLLPDMLYQARLVASSLHEDFSRIDTTVGTGRWHPHDFTTGGGTSAWAIGHTTAPVAANLIQTGLTGALNPGGTILGTAAVLESDPAAPGADSPTLWTDYRVAAHLRAEAGSAIGLAFRWKDSETFYLFAMDQTAGTGRSLYRVSGSGPALMAHDDELFLHGRDYAVVIETIGEVIKVWVDGTLVFHVVDAAPIASGTIAMHCSNASGAVFSDVKVHDLSTGANSAYTFSFTTSCFVDFAHHLHSHDDDAWETACTLSATDLAEVRGNAVSTLDAAATDEEARAFDRLADDLLGTRAGQEPVRTETYRITDVAGEVIGVLVRSPEPIDRSRLALSLLHAPDPAPASVAPSRVKLIAAELGAAQPSDEIVVLLIREPTDLSGWSLQIRPVPCSDKERLDDPAVEWTTIYSFGAEDVLPEGTLVRIHSGPGPVGMVDTARMIERHRAVPGEVGDLKLTGDCVDLRIIGPEGEVAHARRFIDDARYSPIGFMVLRKADDTAFALLPVSNDASFPPGALKVAAVYRRDNRAHVADSLVLTASGDASPEAAQIFVPTHRPTMP